MPGYLSGAACACSKHAVGGKSKIQLADPPALLDVMLCVLWGGGGGRLT